MDRVSVDYITFDGKEIEDCPFAGMNGMSCDATDKVCLFGLTEVRVPEWCPLRKTVKLKKQSRIVDTDF